MELYFVIQLCNHIDLNAYSSRKYAHTTNYTWDVLFFSCFMLLVNEFFLSTEEEKQAQGAFCIQTNTEIIFNEYWFIPSYSDSFWIQMCNFYCHPHFSPHTNP